MQAQSGKRNHRKLNLYEATSSGSMKSQQSFENSKYFMQETEEGPT